MNQSQVIIIGLAVLAIYFGLEFGLEIFRKRIKQADVVAVRFNPETVVNRRVIVASHNHIVVWDASMTRKIKVHKEHVFIADAKAKIDEKVELGIGLK